MDSPMSLTLHRDINGFVRRRDVIVGTAGLCITSSIRSQALVPTRLIALRAPGLSPTNACVAPCIRGRLFDVSDTTSPFDQLVPAAVKLRAALCDFIERPWNGNQPSVSSIKSGVYSGAVRKDFTKYWMTTPERAWRIELSGTAPRSAIQFHYGRDVGWSEGCFIVGRLLQTSDGPGITGSYCTVEDGEASIAKLRAAVEGAGRSRDIQIAVADDDGLFAALNGAPPC